MRWTWCWSFTAIALLLAPACERKRKAPSTRPVAEAQIDAAPEVPVLQDTTPPSKADPPQIKLLDSGREPLEPIRLRHRVGVRDRVAVTLRMTARHEIAGQAAPPLNMPAFRLVLDLEVLELLEDESARYRYEVTQAEIVDNKGVDALVLSTTRSDLEKTVGMTGSGIVDRRGLRRDGELELPADTSDQWKQMLSSITTSLDYLSAPFPQEAVGVGAFWEHYQTLTQNGMQVRQTTIFELTEIDRTKGRLRATIKQSADRQSAFLPGLPMGVEAELLSMTSTGAGEIHFDLGREAPIRANIALESTSSFSIKSGGAQQSMSLQADVGMVIESEAP